MILSTKSVSGNATAAKWMGVALIGVCADTYVIYQSVLGKKDPRIANLICVNR